MRKSVGVSDEIKNIKQNEEVRGVVEEGDREEGAE